MQEQKRPFEFLYKQSLKQLFQSKQRNKKSSFHEFKHADRELQQIFYVFEFSHDNKNKKLFKKKQEIDDFQKAIRSQFPDLIEPPRLADPYESQVKAFLNQIYTIEAIKTSDSFKRFVGLRTIQNRIILSHLQEVLCLFEGTFTLKGVAKHADNFLQKGVNFLTFNKQRYLVVTKSSLYLMENENSPVLQAGIIDRTFQYNYGHLQSFWSPSLTLEIETSQLWIKAQPQNITSFGLFVTVAESLRDPRTNRFYSFAPQRRDQTVQPFIDGQDYFESLLSSLLEAKKQVYIAGWLLSPYFHLRRRPNEQSPTLVNVLTQLGNRGVKIYILLFNVLESIIPNKPDKVVQALGGISNLQILLHPRYMNWRQSHPIYWSHHQKLVIIDRKIAYMGGLDIGYGRFDQKSHQLLDVNGDRWPGVDYCNFRKTDIYQPEKPQISSINRKQYPRMPWHDIGVRLTGSCVQDLQHHFVQYWNHATENLKLVLEPSASTQSASLGGEEDSLEQILKLLYQETFGNQEIFELEKIDLDEIRQQLKKEYQQNEQKFSQLMLKGQKQVQKIVQSQPVPQESTQPFSQTQNAMLGEQEEKLSSVSAQVLRSDSTWGIGLKQTERSILEAYKHLIRNATHYIYIENQFFMSQQHKIPEEICQRIISAHFQKQQFKVIIMLPALPGFEGKPGDSAVLSLQIRLTLNTIKQIYDRLNNTLDSQDVIDRYIYFFSLRTHAAFENPYKPVTEIIYIHSKLMIVDDTYMIIGSANINNRSLAGDRDSQLALVVQDKGQKNLAHKMIRDLIKEHFNFSLGQDVTCFNDAWKELIDISNGNHQIYKELFGCYPDDSIKKNNQIRDSAIPNRQVYEQRVQGIQGHAVSFQRKFLEEQRQQIKPKALGLLLFKNNFT